ncbi:MAG TPA: UPF0182 family protein, partial [Syntrophobacteraceae bacterium]|nr:UPF0182 family protein [Syntrophobacteraceae bacterium]
MQHWKRWLVVAGGLTVLLGAVHLVFTYLFLDFVVDHLWFQSLGYEGYFWLRLLYRYAVFGAVTLLFFMVFFLNFWLASRFLGGAAPKPEDTDVRVRQRYVELAKLFRSGSLKVYTPLSLILAVIIAWPLFHQWEDALFYVFGAKSGVVDPVYAKDISYYLFSLPINTLVQKRLLIAFLLLFASLLVLYYLESRILRKQEQALPRGARVHLGLIVLLVAFIEIWDFVLQRHLLLYTSSHALFYGPGFVEMRVILPLIWASLVTLAGTAFSLAAFLNTRKALKTLILFALGFVAVLGVRYSKFLPRYVDEYLVKPNEISRESPYIANNIQTTLSAYNLSKVETREYSLKAVPSLVSDPHTQEGLHNIPVWDRDLLVDVYKQLQGIRPYYDFTHVDADRYTVNGVYQQVFVAARELNIMGLPTSAQNWINEHLKYTHGYGAVMSSASMDGQEPFTWFLQDLPPRSDYDLSIQQPGIYYGLKDNGYAIAPNDAEEFDYLMGNSEVNVNYQGRGGVALSSFFRKVLFAFYFKEKNIIFSGKTNANSRILFRRNILDGIRTITPYLLLDKDPYCVTTAQGIYWIQDAFTTSTWYPNAQPYQGRLNYIRPAVKIVVDAYHGSIDYYVSSPDDPIIAAYQRMYPGVFKDLAQMPQELRQHLRYPKDLFEIQMSIYATYHQTDPEVYYKQEDAWEFARVYAGNQVVPLKSYFLTLNLIDEVKHEFVLVRSMTPKNLDILRAIMVVGNDSTNYGRMLVYSFPKSSVIYGPSQISALINQDPFISQQFSLWNQAGSEVELGNMLILPIGGTVLYIQPVYLKSTSRLKIPELQRLIVSQGEMVVMDSSLQRALKTLEDRLRARVEQWEQRRGMFQAPPKSSPPITPAPSQPPAPPAQMPSRAPAAQPQPIPQTPSEPTVGGQPAAGLPHADSPPPG